MSTEKDYVVRHFHNYKDYEWLGKWYKDWNYELHEGWEDTVPVHGAVVLSDGEPVFVAFLYLTDSAVAYIDGAIKRKGVDIDVRWAQSAIEFLLPFTRGPVMASTTYPSLQAGLRETGFRQNGPHFVRIPAVSGKVR